MNDSYWFFFLVIDFYYNTCKCGETKLLALFILKQEWVKATYIYSYFFFKETLLSPGSYYNFYVFTLIPEPL